MCGVCSGELWLTRKKSCLLSSIFSAGRVALGKRCIGLQKAHLRTPGMEFFVQCPGLIFLAARWSGPAASASIFLVCLDYSLRVSQSLWDSFLYLWKLRWFLYCCYSISTILACLFSVGVWISWKKLCWMRACRRKWHLVFPTLYIIIVDSPSHGDWKVLSVSPTIRLILYQISRFWFGLVFTTGSSCYALGGSMVLTVSFRRRVI